VIDYLREESWVLRLCTMGFAVAAVAALLLLAGLPAAMANSQPTTAATTGVKIDNFSFRPGALTVAMGTTLTWTNRDDTPHTVVSTDGVFKSKVLDTDEKFSYTFAKAGTFGTSARFTRK
jgi:plastocyanin